MDVEQRYIEEADFEFEELAYEKIITLGNIGYDLAMTIQGNASRFRKKQGIVQNYAAMVSTDGRDVPFEIWVLNQHEDKPIIMDMVPIDTDRYLDMINSFKSITHEIKRDNN